MFQIAGVPGFGTVQGDEYDVFGVGSRAEFVVHGHLWSVLAGLDDIRCAAGTPLRRTIGVLRNQVTVRHTVAFGKGMYHSGQ
ncbi:hypothetical protein MINS_26990 [Mycolicibacterium insubricum]|nr:hypothetical protein MINS_26990 [Mycolicibacterium insubricum]